VFFFESVVRDHSKDPPGGRAYVGGTRSPRSVVHHSAGLHWRASTLRRLRRSPQHRHSLFGLREGSHVYYCVELRRTMAGRSVSRRGSAGMSIRRRGGPCPARRGGPPLACCPGRRSLTWLLEAQQPRAGRAAGKSDINAAVPQQREAVPRSLLSCSRRGESGQPPARACTGLGCRGASPPRYVGKRTWVG
jgi:hypothetical protein